MVVLSGYLVKNESGDFLKKYISFILLIFLAGGGTMFLPTYFKNRSEEKAKQKTLLEKKAKEEAMKSISSNENTIKLKDIPYESLETEEYSKQIYFLNVEKLYDYFSFVQVENIKLTIQEYIHSYISEDILDVIVITDTISTEGDNICFELNIEGVKQFSVEITKNDKDIKNINILHYLK